MDLKTLPMRRRIEERVARILLLGASLVAVGILVWLIARLVVVGAPHISWSFFTSFASRRPADAGIKAGLLGSAWLALLTLALALPVGIAAGIYMNEYAKANRFTRILRTTTANLAGVPSIVFGILGLAIFVRAFGLGYVLLAGALTLAILSLPVIIVATEEALKAVPKSMREAAYGLGATKWQVTKDHVLPYAMPGITTGAILALARAVGETAPLILVGGATAVFFVPDSPLSLYSALPLQTFNWALNPKAEFRELAAAATVVLLAFILMANMIALFVRNRYQRKLRW
jgi:phosphate transport system permease protein